MSKKKSDKKAELRYGADVYIFCKTRFGELTDENLVSRYTPKGAIIVIARELKVSPSVVAHCVAKKLEPNEAEIKSKLDYTIGSHRVKTVKIADDQLTLPFN